MSSYIVCGVSTGGMLNFDLNGCGLDLAVPIAPCIDKLYSVAIIGAREVEWVFPEGEHSPVFKTPGCFCSPPALCVCPDEVLIEIWYEC